MSPFIKKKATVSSGLLPALYTPHSPGALGRIGLYWWEGWKAVTGWDSGVARCCGTISGLDLSAGLHYYG